MFYAADDPFFPQMLRLASNLLDADDERLLASIASVIFMACPLRKTDYGSMVIAMKSMAAATTGVPIDDGTLGRMLGADEDVHLTHLGRDAFDAVWREYNFRVKVYRETSIAPPSHPWGELALVGLLFSFQLRHQIDFMTKFGGSHIPL